MLTQNCSAVPMPGLPGPYRLLFSEDWRAAAQTWAGLGAPYEQALFLLQGNLGAQHRALALLKALGARAAVERAREVFVERGGRIRLYRLRASTRANRAGLTMRQMDVLRLLDQGPLKRRDCRRALRVRKDRRPPRFGNPRKDRGEIARRGGRDPRNFDLSCGDQPCRPFRIWHEVASSELTGLTHCRLPCARCE